MPARRPRPRRRWPRRDSDTNVVAEPADRGSRGGGTIRITLDVDGQYGIVPAGEVKVYDGSKVIATVTLTAADNGGVTFTLPKFNRGIHLGVGEVRRATSSWTPSSSFPSVLIVF